MFGNDPDKDWEKFGRQQPYFGVVNSEAFRRENLDEESRARFFATGEEYIEWIWNELTTRLDPGFKPKDGLDFGCGVGRLAIPLASRCKTITGIDVSPSMLEEAGRNCRSMGIGNAEFHAGVHLLPPDRKFDFINSFIVFQHIVPKKGWAIFRELLGRLNPGGIGAIHFIYHSELTRRAAIVGAIRKRSNLANMFFNVLKGLPPGSPWMQMNDYDLGNAAMELRKAGCGGFHALLTDHAGFHGAILLFRKP